MNDSEKLNQSEDSKDKAIEEKDCDTNETSQKEEKNSEHTEQSELSEQDHEDDGSKKAVLETKSEEEESKSKQKRFPIKRVATVVILVLLCGGLAIASPNIIWLYSLKTGSENLDNLKMDAATRDFETAVKMARMFPESDERLASSLNILCTVLLAQGKYDQAEKTIEESLTVHKRLYGNGIDSAKPILLKAGFYRRQGLYNQAVEEYNKALKLTEKEKESDKTYVKTLLVLSILEIYRGNYDKADAGFRKVIELEKKDVGESYDTSSGLTMNFGRIAEAKGSYKTAEKLYRKALKSIGTVTDKNRAEQALIRNLIAELYLSENNTEIAGPLIEKAYTLSQSLSAKEYLQAANLQSLYNLTSFYLKEEDFEKATKLVDKSLPIATERLGIRHPSYAKILAQKAELLANQGKLKEARELILKAKQLQIETVGEEHRYIAELIVSLAKLDMQERKFPEAETHLNEALLMFEKKLGNQHPEYATTLLELALLKELTEKSSEANDLRFKANKIIEDANKR